MSGDAQEQLRRMVRAEVKASTLTQKQIAKRIVMSEVALSRVLLGHRSLTVPVAERILGALGLELVIAARARPGRETP